MTLPLLSSRPPCKITNDEENSDGQTSKTPAVGGETTPTPGVENIHEAAALSESTCNMASPERPSLATVGADGNDSGSVPPGQDEEGGYGSDAQNSDETSGWVEQEVPASTESFFFVVPPLPTRATKQASLWVRIAFVSDFISLVLCSFVSSHPSVDTWALDRCMASGCRFTCFRPLQFDDTVYENVAPAARTPPVPSLLHGTLGYGAPVCGSPSVQLHNGRALRAVREPESIDLCTRVVYRPSLLRHWLSAVCFRICIFFAILDYLHLLLRPRV